MNSSLKQKVVLALSYNGANYYGWQSQPDLPTVQDTLQQAIQEFTQLELTAYCAGRTDTGVHAVEQIVHLNTELKRRDESWVRGINTFLPADIRVKWSKTVDSSFHARFSAQQRTYIYLLRTERVQSALWHFQTGWEFMPLSLERMQEAAQYFIGQHDFTSFRSSQCQAYSPVRELHRLEIKKQGSLLVFTITADGFLHHMIRNILGCLIFIGKEKQPPLWVKELLELKNRKYAAPTFMSNGLYLAQVSYPDQYMLPTQDIYSDPLSYLLNN